MEPASTSNTGCMHLEAEGCVQTPTAESSFAPPPASLLLNLPAHRLILWSHKLLWFLASVGTPPCLCSDVLCVEQCPIRSPDLSPVGTLFARTSCLSGHTAEEDPCSQEASFKKMLDGSSFQNSMSPWLRLCMTLENQPLILPYQSLVSRISQQPLRTLQPFAKWTFKE